MSVANLAPNLDLHKSIVTRKIIQRRIYQWIHFYKGYFGCSIKVEKTTLLRLISRNNYLSP